MARVQMTIFGLVLMMACAVSGNPREWYCKREANKFEVCRKTRTLQEESNAPDECKCENMKFTRASDSNYELYGGPEQCNDPDDAFCFVSSDSACFDAEYSSVNERTSNIWKDKEKEIYYSYEACDAAQDDKIGNEEVIQGVKIKDDRIREVNDNGILTDTEVTFFTDDWEECQGECLQRQGNCGAWSFDKEEELCYIHTVESCCGQFGKRKKDPNWVSGYACHKCWSTKRGTDCPCSIKDRQEVPKTAHGAGGRAPLHATSSGSLTVQSVNVAKNECKCKPKRTKRGRLRCKKPFCVGPKEEGCKDKRKCRLRKKRRGRRSLLDLLHL